MQQRGLNTKEVAERTGMSVSFLKKARRNGAPGGRTPGPCCYRVGKRAIRYRIEDVDDWIDQHKRQDAFR